MVTFNRLMGKAHARSGGSTSNCSNDRSPCPQLPGTILRIFIPSGAVINLLNLIEVTSPSGICFIARLPFLGEGILNTTVQSLINAVRQAGGTVEPAEQ